MVNVISSLTFDDISPVHMTTLDLKRLIDFLDELNARCTLFVVPNLLKDKQFVSELKKAVVKGHELALHGVDHVKNEFGGLYPIPLPIPIRTLKNQKQRLKKGIKTMVALTGINPIGFRAPYLLYSSATIKALSSLGFRYDSSLSLFKPVHALYFRINWSRRIRPFVTNGIVEICVSGDYTFKLNSNNFHSFLNRALCDFKWIRSNKGVFVLNSHPQRLGKIGYSFLKTLISKISKDNNFYRLSDIAEMYLKHT